MNISNGATRKIPLLRYLQQVTFYRSLISGYDTVVSPESTVSEATFASVGYAIQVLSHPLFTETTRISPKFKALCMRDPPQLPMYPQTVPPFAQFIQLSIHYFKPRSVCFQNANVLISSQVVKLHGLYLPENVSIHADLDWKLTVIWGSTNRIFLIKSKIAEEDDLNLGTLAIADHTEGDNQAMEAVTDIKSDEGGWEDIDEISDPPSDFPSQRTQSTPSISLTTVSQMNSTSVLLIPRIWKIIITTSMSGMTNLTQVMVLEGSMMTGLACPVI
ncbi:hypothetical protein I307_01589 [Cryptococcus deuterogattii 99/473]|uniref:Uncharacterized protein n=2 Tax=Cryptococcus deuterogattii TaxID=1859096 RepID=A0A0D0UXJ4_9TREE|nr:hypothetical protein I309_04115 [Cryptococcus deuterogattii LA55]KIR38884.1 hypothetical protein I313_05024 [Cryptococcus deuterogattii Ram5]KIR75911.1 hypothetical protein I310_00609 [Cryptococcus deuterogattii CA1014]KIR95853.1 hypothetical protein I304_00609 [Cryptococcus deuterogattii CBS 10090]KIY58796.1 hypothetical protein I307_01589 [Cryptococcus deuterogattii 99/473]